MLTPKGCHVRYVALNGRGGAEVRVSCPVSGSYTESNNRSVVVKARELNFRGSHVTGAARIDFVLAPAHAICRKSGGEISCKLVGETSSESLRGLGIWPFSKKKPPAPPKRRIGDRTIMWVPGSGTGPAMSRRGRGQVMAGSRKRKRR